MAIRTNHCVIVSHPKFSALSLVMVRYINDQGEKIAEKKYLPHEAEQMFYEIEHWDSEGQLPELEA